MDREKSEIREIIEAAILEQVFPGAVVGFVKDNNLSILPFGHLTYEANAEQVTKATVYDLASLTKVIPTNSIILSLIEKGLLSTDDQVIEFIPEINTNNRDKILIKHLLTFTTVFDLPKPLSFYAHGGKAAILSTIYNAPLKYPSGKRYQYSNIPALLLGMVAERIVKKPLDIIADEMFFKPLQMNSTTFYPKRLAPASIAPTEINERGEVLGEVHDETAWALHKEGLVSGHAGLFSSARDLLIFGQMLLSNGQLNNRRYLEPSTVKKMRLEVINNGGYGMSLGWEMNQSDYMGSDVSPKIFGKDGFTGTMFLADPFKKRCLVVLSNRTYPKRPKTSETINKVRRKLAGIVLA
ncbi:MAG: serine hydrolase domain-containing protein [Candidatus Saccharimonadales bacterium]